MNKKDENIGIIEYLICTVFLSGVTIIGVSLFLLIVSLSIECITGINIINLYLHPFFKSLILNN